MPKERKPKTFNLKQYAKNFVRRASYRYPARTQALNAVRIPAPASWPNKRVSWVVPCSACHKLFELHDVQLDHKEPIIPLSGWPEAPKSELYDAQGGPCMNVLFYRTFIKPEGYAVLCKPCHAIKTKAENAARRAA